MLTMSHLHHRAEQAGALGGGGGLGAVEERERLIFDEVALVGELAFKVIEGKYQYVGMVDKLDVGSMFGKRAVSSQALEPLSLLVL